MLEHSQLPVTRAFLVHVHLSFSPDTAVVDEFSELVSSTGAEIVKMFVSNQAQIQAKYFIGSGKVEELQSALQLYPVNLIVFNHNLSPSQERNLERVLKVRVIDRISLILDIFAQRARTHEGKLQVELAQLKHLSTRLVRGWTHLERQKGGIGLRGPGETQLEVDKRLIGRRIDYISARLNKVSKRRQLNRHARSKAQIPTLSLVGYTNAGKSTLFNQLTQANVYAQDQLFATLDPTFRRIELGYQLPAILADTVGFIGNLPHELVAAFKATLEETINADLIIHVIDRAHPQYQQQKQAVEAVLSSIGADEVPRIEVYNKVDLLEDSRARVTQGTIQRVWLSAAQAYGLDLLQQLITKKLYGELQQDKIVLAPQGYYLRQQLFERHAIVTECFDEQGNLHLELQMPAHAWQGLRKTHSRVIIASDSQGAEK